MCCTVFLNSDDLSICLFVSQEMDHYLVIYTAMFSLFLLKNLNLDITNLSSYSSYTISSLADFLRVRHL